MPRTRGCTGPLWLVTAPNILAPSLTTRASMGEDFGSPGGPHLQRPAAWPQFSYLPLRWVGNGAPPAEHGSPAGLGLPSPHLPPHSSRSTSTQPTLAQAQPGFTAIRK